MSLKKNTVDVLGQTTENIVDNTVDIVANNVLNELLKAIPFTSVLTGGYQVFTEYHVNERARIFLEFITACESQSPQKISEIFKNKSNLEMGMEIMNALDTSYLVIHAKMIATTALLYDSELLKRDKFLKYIHIIPRLTSYLLSQIKLCYERNVSEIHQLDYGIKGVSDEDLTIELELYGFVKIFTHVYGDKQYIATDDLMYFYEHIFQPSNN